MKLLTILFLLLPVAGFAFERTIEGKVISVTDGETIKIKTHQNKVEKIRLAQIHTCGWRILILSIKSAT